jgi:hypothetical protein
LTERVEPPLLISRQINKFGCFRNTRRFGARDAVSMSMRRLP